MANKTRDATFPARTHHGNAAVLQLGVTEPHDSLVGDRRRDAERVKHLAKSLGTYTLPAQMQAARHGGWAGSQRAQGEATDCCAVSDTRSRGHGAPSLRAIQRRAAVHILSTSAIFGTATRAEPATGMAGAFMRAGAMRAGTIIAMVICQGGEDPRVGACRGTGRRRGRAYRLANLPDLARPRAQPYNMVPRPRRATATAHGPRHRRPPSPDLTGTPGHLLCRVSPIIGHAVLALVQAAPSPVPSRMYLARRTGGRLVVGR